MHRQHVCSHHHHPYHHLLYYTRTMMVCSSIIRSHVHILDCILSIDASMLYFLATETTITINLLPMTSYPHRWIVWMKPYPINPALSQSYRHVTIYWTVSLHLTQRCHISLLLTTIQARNNLLEHELMLMKNPTYDQVFAYIDRQVAAVGREGGRCMLTITIIIIIILLHHYHYHHHPTSSSPS
jgi:hypothetical protein